MEEMLNLRGAIMSKFKTISAFADAIGWKRNKASRIINDVTKLDADDMIAIAKVIDVKTPEQFMFLFFNSLSTKWTSEKRESKPMLTKEDV